MDLLKQWLWPDVSIRNHSQGAIQEAFWVAIAVSAYRLLWVLISYLRDSDQPLNRGVLLSGLLFALLAIGIYFRSRTAATLAFAIYVGEFIHSSSIHLQFPIIPALVSLALLAGARGTFAYRKFAPSPADLPSVAESFRSLKSPSSPDDSTPT